MHAARRGGAARRALAALTLAAITTACAGGTGQDGPAAPGGPTGRAADPPGAETPGASPSPRPNRALPRPGEVSRIPVESLPPVIDHIPTKRKVVFLTIDDGWEQDPGFVEEVRRGGVPVTAFVTRDSVEGQGRADAAAGGGRYTAAEGWPYFTRLRDAGVPIENHTLTHPNLRLLGPAAQKAEICGMSKRIEQRTGRRPWLFRPPFGNHNTATRVAAKECGIGALIMWTATVQKDAKIAYQVPDKKLRPGDIILMHFRPGLATDFKRLIRKIHRRGYEFGDLPAYLAAAGVRPRDHR
ncbi:polysaccharide deacetylase family protein [Bailinhaonella thermotolerans]|uniref:Polysaccharide deacetylase family protein n=1 Tax=Bailinhaonella thermotolerans TaxID=1070861 RepID=A0A3A4ASA6_9ACTN|nr:polysaccharide deacetylase family protein [Bailinhaonella thermotolerans]RJL31469.1 polysaccharide deacetylase family protein [Bailinhaonella thermotolerans]